MFLSLARDRRSITAKSSETKAMESIWHNDQVSLLKHRAWMMPYGNQLRDSLGPVSEPRIGGPPAKPPGCSVHRSQGDRARREGPASWLKHMKKHAYHTQGTLIQTNQTDVS